MKTTFIAAIFIIFVGMTASYAGGFMLLHVGSADGNSGTLPANALLSQTGVCIQSQLGTCILVQ